MVGNMGHVLSMHLVDHGLLLMEELKLLLLQQSVLEHLLQLGLHFQRNRVGRRYGYLGISVALFNRLLGVGCVLKELDYLLGGEVLCETIDVADIALLALLHLHHEGMQFLLLVRLFLHEFLLVLVETLLVPHGHLLIVVNYGVDGDLDRLAIRTHLDRVLRRDLTIGDHLGVLLLGG